MALGFSTGSSFGSRTIVPDKGLSKTNTPVIFRAEFGDGYEQRIANGINTLDQTMSVSFSTRPKAEIDDLVAFFESLGGVSKFEMIIDDTNGAETIKVTCKSWSQTWVYDDFYTLSASFQRCYEA